MPADQKSDQLGVWLDAEVKDNFQELAYQRRSSMSEIARELIIEEIEESRESGELETIDEESAPN